MVNYPKPMDHPFMSSLDPSRQETNLFSSSTIYHVSQELNKEVDDWANYGARSKFGELVISGTLQHPIP